MFFVEIFPLSELELKVYSNLFHDFCITGGMTAIVSSYLQKGTFEGVLAMQQQLILNYKEDAKKYAKGLDKTIIINVLNHIPVQLANENKKFQISKVSTEEVSFTQNWMNNYYRKIHNGKTPLEMLRKEMGMDFALPF